MWTLQMETKKQRGDMTCLARSAWPQNAFAFFRKKKKTLFYEHDVILLIGKLSKASKYNEERKSV